MSKYVRRSFLNQARVILAVPLMLASFVALVLVPGATPASATPAGTGPTPIISGAAYQTLETNVETQVAGLRGVPDDLRNQLWSRGEIEADMYSQLVNAAETTPSSSVVAAFSANYQNTQETLANEAESLYTQWSAGPCSFKLPVRDGLPARAAGLSDLVRVLDQRYLRAGTVRPLCGHRL